MCIKIFEKMMCGKNVLIVIVLSLILLNGCISEIIQIESDDSSEESATTTESTNSVVSKDSFISEISEIIEVSEFYQDENFEEDDVFAQMYNNNFYPNNFAFNYSFIYKDSDVTYVTMPADTYSGFGLYCYTDNGEKSYVGDDGWYCYVKNGVLYYYELHMFEEDEETSRLISYKNGEKTVLIDHVGYFCYSNNGIYYNKNNALYNVSFDGQNIKEIYKPSKGSISTFLEYDNYLWICTYDDSYEITVHKVSLEGANISDIPITVNDFKVRNHYFYYHDYSAHDGTAKFFRYSTITGEIEELPYINEYMMPFTFTDDYFLFQRHDVWLYRADKNFNNKEKIIDIGTIEELNVLDNYIYVIDFVEDQDGFQKQVVKQYDADGNFIKTYE